MAVFKDVLINTSMLLIALKCKKYLGKNGLKHYSFNYEFVLDIGQF